jgi:hypothetical protein
MNPDLIRIQKDLDALKQEFFRNNFSNSQDFPKYSRFNTRLKVPSYASLPTTCEVGEIVESDGKLHICSAANTWEIVGDQS